MEFSHIQLFIFDLDGVIYLGNELISGVGEVLEVLTKKKKDIFYLTNNSTRTRAQFRQKLESMGIKAEERQIITSAYATAQYLKQRKPNGVVYIIGEEGLINEFIDAGFRVYFGNSAKNDFDYVVVGLDSNFDYRKLAIAMRSIERGAKFIATNSDPTLPTEDGNLPGAGTMISALSAAVYSQPSIIIGKPNTFMLELILKMQKIPSSSAVIVGDRYTTDIQAGINAHIRTILVKTGTGLYEMKQIPDAGPKPDLILDSVADLIQYI